ncbi:MAG: hypothetical protein H6577_13795 [Lewinellaceae bacterium]|nr:hypothetical protein [Saprospiraceae bacterium]MCB9339199.1 hypothetical protein [Lewinellaceae bacterium]
MHRITIHIWQKAATAPLGRTNLNHAVFQIQKLRNNPSAAGLNLTYTCPTVRNPAIVTIAGGTLIPAPGGGDRFDIFTGATVNTPIQFYSGQLGAPWRRMNKDVPDESVVSVLQILNGTGSAATDFSMFKQQHAHSYEQCLYLALRSINLNHTRAQTAVNQLKKNTMARKWEVGIESSQVKIDLDYLTGDLVARLSSQGFV